MILSQIILNGYRNFKNSTINVNEKTLIIGANDIGKSNLLYAVRLLLDRTISEVDLEPNESDFYVYDNDLDELSITLKFTDVIEDCVLSKLGTHCSNEGELYLQYKAYKDSLEYEFLAGCSIENLEELQGRFYLKVLNLKYIGSNRDFNRYINKERKKLIHEAKKLRTEEQTESDEQLLDEINDHLIEADEGINDLTFVKKSTEMVDTELDNLSFHHSTQKVVFDAGSSDVNKFIDNLSIASEVNGKRLKIGGDGRNNQIFLALWSAQNEMGVATEDEVSIYCIEEPEAHLHPHQQRKLSEYLSQSSASQIFITSHSPHIASEFSPNSIVRLHRVDNATIGANNGCSKIIEDEFYKFGYRINTIAPEAFFADVVFLVEGPSEIVFYKALAQEKGIDLDHLNISIVMVDGIGFSKYISILNALGIRWVLRTDNDRFKIQDSVPEQHRFAGVERGLSYIIEHFTTNDAIDQWIAQIKPKLRWIGNQEMPTPESLTTSETVIKWLKDNYKIYIAQKDLENDLVGQLSGRMNSVLGVRTDNQAIKHLQTRKATHMFEFVYADIKSGGASGYGSLLSTIPDSADIIRPLMECKALAEEIYV